MVAHSVYSSAARIAAISEKSENTLFVFVCYQCMFTRHKNLS
jgi:hypothetical protein